MALANTVQFKTRNAMLVDIGLGVAIDNGVWTDTEWYESGTVHVLQSGTSTVQIRGSNASARPAPATTGSQIGSDIVGGTTPDALVAITPWPRWVKVAVSSYTSGLVAGEIFLKKV
jgi:hypothetical protein